MADRILVLEGGRILEQGSHDELLARGGRYARLFSLQAQGYQ
jgi:ATP-binding cassette subfamily B protein